MEKVLVGCPTYEGKAYALNQYIEAIKNLTYTQADLLIVDNSDTDTYIELIQSKQIPAIKGPTSLKVPERIATSRNLLRERVLQGYYDAFLSLEQDVIPPPNIIERLLAHNKPCVSGLYYGLRQEKQRLVRTAMAWVEPDEAFVTKIKNNPTLYPTLYSSLAKNNFDTRDLQRPITPPEVKGKTALIKLKGAGLGCMLIRRAVLHLLSFRVDQSYDDMAFCKDLRKRAIPLYLDPTVRCTHIVGNS